MKTEAGNTTVENHADRHNGDRNGRPVTTAEKLDDFTRAALSASRSTSVDGFLREAADRLGRLLETPCSSILMLEGRRLYHAGSTNLPPAYIEAIDGIEIGPEVGTCGASAYSGSAQVTYDIESDPRWEPFRGAARAAGLRSCWSVPLKLPDATVVGTFAVYSAEPHSPSPDRLALAEAYASIVALGFDNLSRQARVAASYETAVVALTSALDCRDDYTGSHSEATSSLALEVGRRIGVGEEELRLIGQVAALHDVGKLGIPTEILLKPGPLTPEQTAVMRRHPLIGEQLLRQIPGLEDVAAAVRHEHERWDGTGYPDGLRGEEIPLASRIVFACDAYHAMISERPYRPPLDQEAAVAELKANAGTQFDPDAVAALLEALGEEGAALGCSPRDLEEREQTAILEQTAAELGAEDIFVFRKVAPTTYSHLAGIGRGAGWAGNIELDALQEPYFHDALARGAVRCVSRGAPSRIVGPYFARSAIVVPSRNGVVVVFGSSSESLADVCERDTEPLAERVALIVDQVSPAKRLADELEVLEAVRSVTTIAADGVEANLREVADRAAAALSCEFCGIVIRDAEANRRAGWADRGWLPGSEGEIQRALAAVLSLHEDPDGLPLLIQEMPAHGDGLLPAAFSAGNGVASLHALPIDGLGVMLLVHAEENPRGFTTLCQRVARSVSESAGLVVRRALAQERLAIENVKLEKRAATDPLTGLLNRGAWEDLLEREQLDLARSGGVATVVLFDVDDLKRVNDEHGHLAGDRLLRAFGSILAESTRTTDFAARIGGDEFAALLRHCDGESAERWCRRVIEAVEARAGRGEPLRVSFGFASAPPADTLAEAVAGADDQLYRNKGRNGS